MAESDPKATQQEAAAQGGGASQEDIVDQLLRPEVQESLTTLVENLPKLAELTNLLTKYYDLFQSIASDDVLVGDFKEGFEEVLEPLQGKAKEYASTAIEAKDRAETSESTVGLFGLLRMLKDPQVQKVFRFVQAYMDVSEEKDTSQEEPKKEVISH